MLTARCRNVALAIAVSLVISVTWACSAGAQCMPDSPNDGNSQTPTCESDEHHGGHGSSVTIYQVPLHVFASNPIVSALAWLSVRSFRSGNAGEAVRPKGVLGSKLRVGRTPKQVAW